MNHRDKRHNDPADEPHALSADQPEHRPRAPRSKLPRQRVSVDDLMHDMLTGEKLEPLIRHLRRERELTLAGATHMASDIAGRSLAASRLSDWEIGRVAVPLEWLPALAAVYDTPIEELAVAAIRTQCQHPHRR